MEKSMSATSPLGTAARIYLLIVGIGVLLVIVGLLEQVVTFWVSGAVVILFAVANWPRQIKVKRLAIEQPSPNAQPPAVRPLPAGGVTGSVDPSDTDGLVKQMLAQHRYALLLRPQIAADLDPALFDKTLAVLQEQMALVPDGEVTLGPVDNAYNDDAPVDQNSGGAHAHVVRVKRFFLDRWLVTNRQYFEFVAAGGYQNTSLWDESVLPAVLDFVDTSGEPGPRFWKEGCFLEGADDHPVVGVSWHEAAAYARWVGKRLPSDAEWVKAGVWPVPTSDGGRVQRAYPWGDDMDRTRANLWGSGPGHAVGVHDFAQGISLGGVYQLIGNVWEWTAGDFTGGDHPLGKLTFKTPMKSIRGGAFDTYFDNQATCQFQSGDGTLARKRNIGFRLAIGVCDLMLNRPVEQTADSTTPPRNAIEEQGGGGDACVATTDQEPSNREPPQGREVCI